MNILILDIYRTIININTIINRLDYVKIDLLPPSSPIFTLFCEMNDQL